MEYAVAPTSLAHTFGNVTAYITEYVKHLFTQDYFKTVNISSSIAYKQFNVFDNTNKEFLKKQKPMLIIRPRLETNSGDLFLSGTMLTSRITDNFLDLDFGNLQEFIRDVNKGLFMKFLLNRVKMYFDVTIILESQMEQLDRFVYLNNRVRQDHPFFIKTALESNIPKNLMGVIAKDSGQDITKIPAFLNYLNNNATFPITYKLKNSTGKDEFFRYYPVQMDTMFTGLNMDDGSKKGFISDAYTINFTISTEFFISGLYYYFPQNPEVIRDFDFNAITDGGKSIIPMFTISNLFSIDAPVGWNMYASSMFNVVHDKLPDTLPFRSILNATVTSAVDYHTAHSIPYTTFMKVFVMKDNVKLTEVTDYTVDYAKLTLNILNTNKTSTYRLLVYVNTMYINNLIGSIFKIGEQK